MPEVIVAKDFYTSFKNKQQPINVLDNIELEGVVNDVASYIEHINLLQTKILQDKVVIAENTTKSISEVISSSNNMISDREQQAKLKSNIDLSLYEHKSFEENELPPILQNYADKSQGLQENIKLLATGELRQDLNQSLNQAQVSVITKKTIDENNLFLLGKAEQDSISENLKTQSDIFNTNTTSEVSYTDTNLNFVDNVDSIDNSDTAIFDDDYIDGIDYNIETESFDFNITNSDQDHVNTFTEQVQEGNDHLLSKIVDGNPNQAHKTQNMLTNSSKSSYNLSKYTDDDFFDNIEQDCSFYRLLKQANFLPHSHDFSALTKSELKQDEVDTSKVTLVIEKGFEFLVNDPNWLSDIEKRLSIVMHQALKLSVKVIEELPENSPRAYARRAHLQEIEKQRQKLSKVKGLAKVFKVFQEDLQTASIELLK